MVGEDITLGGTSVGASVTLGALAVCVAAIAVCSAHAVFVAATPVAIVFGVGAGGSTLHASSSETTVKQDINRRNI